MQVTTNQWSSERALECAHSVFDFLCAGRGNSLNKFWPIHPEDDSQQPFNKGLYNGATGTLWALCELSRRLARPLPFDPKVLIENIYQDYLKLPDTGEVVPSFLLGETGILLLSQKISPSPSTLQRLRICIESNIRNPVNEALWGCPGTMLAALRINEVKLYQVSADYLFEHWIRRTEDGIWSWTQDMYGRKAQYTGAGHGFFGNVHALLEGFSHLTLQQQEALLARTANASIQTALVENQHVNWHPHFGLHPGRIPLVQWCHGAPGIITSLRSFPKKYSIELEGILLKAGELIWAAGPLQKGIGICHGTDGNGYALLRLFQRSQNQLWLDRAREFATHAIEQRNGRYSLWTGEAGLGLFLLDCIDAQADFPSLDYF